MRSLLELKILALDLWVIFAGHVRVILGHVRITLGSLWHHVGVMFGIIFSWHPIRDNVSGKCALYEEYTQ